MGDDGRRLSISELIQAEMNRAAQNRQAMAAPPQNLGLPQIAPEQPRRMGFEWERIGGMPLFPSGVNIVYPTIWQGQQFPMNQSAVPIQSELDGKVANEPSFASHAVPTGRGLPQLPNDRRHYSEKKRRASPHVQEPLSPRQEQILDHVIMHCHYQHLFQGYGQPASDIVIDVIRMWNDLHTKEVISGKPGIGGILSYETAAKRIAVVLDPSHKEMNPATSARMQQEAYPLNLHTRAAIDSMQQKQRASQPVAVARLDPTTMYNEHELFPNQFMAAARPSLPYIAKPPHDPFQKRLSLSDDGSSGRPKRQKLSEETTEVEVAALGDILERNAPAASTTTARGDNEVGDDRSIPTISAASKQLKEAEAIAAEAMNEIQQQSRSPDWKSRYSALVRYRIVYGHTRVPLTYKGEPGFTHLDLGEWVADVRREFAKKKRGERSTLTAEQIDKLKKIDFQWEEDDSTLQRRQKEDWEMHYNALAIYTAENGNARVPDKFEDDGLQLGKWVSLQRFKLCLKNRGLPNTISEEQFVRLNQIGFDWDTRSRGTSQLPLSTLVEAFGEPRQPLSILDDTLVSEGSDMRKLKFLDELTLEEASNVTSEESLAYCLQIVGLVPDDHATRVKLVEQHVHYRIKSGESGGSDKILKLIGSEGYLVNEKSSNLTGRCLRCGLRKIGIYHQNGCSRDSIQYCSNPYKQVGWRVPKGFSVGDVRSVATPQAVKQEWEWLKETYGYADYEHFPGW